MLRIINIDVSVAKTAWTLFDHSGYGIMFMDGDPSLVLSIAFHSNQMTESALYLERSGLFHFPEGHGFDRFFIQHLAGSGTIKIGVLEQPSKDRPIYERGGVIKSSPGELYQSSMAGVASFPMTEPLSTTHDLEFLSGYVKYITNAVVANRYVAYAFLTSGSKVLTVEGSTLAQTASLSWVYKFGDTYTSGIMGNLSLNVFGLGGSQMVRQPFLRKFIIPAGSSFMVAITNSDPGDVMSGELFFRKIIL